MIRFEAKERICFPGEDKFIVVGPCGDRIEVYSTAPTMAEAEEEAARLNQFYEIE